MGAVQVDTPPEERTSDPTGTTLRMSVAEGMCYAVMLGLSESYLGAFAVALGHTDLSLALLATVPLLAGAVLTLWVGWFVRILGGRKPVVVFGATLQALSLLGFVLVARVEEYRLWPFLVVKTVFWASGALIAPAWGAWMEALTRNVHRERYFGVRSGLVEVALLLSFVGAGLWLQYADHTRRMKYFEWMFLSASAARLLSSGLLVKQYEPEPGRPRPKQMMAHLRAAARSSRWQIAVYLGLLMGGTQVAVPFFTPYMLRDLKLGFGEFSGLLALSIMAKAATFPLCHRVATGMGLRRLLWIAGIGVAIIPLWWMWFHSLTALVIIQVIGGLAWAGLEYSSFQLLLRSAAPAHQLEFLAVSGSLTGVLQLAGAVAASWLLATVDGGYPMIFGVSAALRCVALVALVVAVRPRDVAVALPRLFVRLIGVRPTAGAVHSPMVGEPSRGAAESTQT